MTQNSTIISSAELLKHWQGHRRLTRRVIEAFPEKEFFEYSIGGMRSFAAMVQELLAIAVPGTREIIGAPAQPLNEHIKEANSKDNILRLWDEATAEIDQLWPQITEARFREEICLFGKYKGAVWDTILYFIDNEVHHRGQGYVYLRSLGIEPPFFWEK